MPEIFLLSILLKVHKSILRSPWSIFHIHPYSLPPRHAHKKLHYVRELASFWFPELPELLSELEALGTRMELIESKASCPVSCEIEVEGVPRMTSINTDEEDTFPVLNRRSPCVHSSSLVRCACDETPCFDDEEDSPLISYQNHSDGSDNYLTDIHCHEAKPIYSNAKARRKLVIASFVCLLFVVAEVVGKVCRSEWRDQLSTT